MHKNPFLRLRKRSAFLSIVSLLLFVVGARAEEWGDYSYSVDNGTSITISKYNGTDVVVEIPFEIAGLPVKTIGYQAFSDVTSLFEVIIPDSVEVIGGHAFSSCSGLRLVELGTGVNQILYGAFSSNFLLRVLFKGNAPTLEGYAFGDASKRGFSLYYEVGANGFSSPEWQGYPCAQWDAASFQPWVYEVVNDEVVLYDYAGLAHDLTTPATIEGKPVTSIGQGAFNSHSGLTGTFTIGNSVTRIEWNPFSNCDGLSEIVIPASVTYMDGGFARACDQLTAISVDPANPDYQSVDGVLLQLGQTELSTCPAGRSGSYSIPEGVLWVQNGAFDGCNALTGLHLSSTITDFHAIPLLGWNGEVSLMQTITVDASNPNYSASDGMLFSKDDKTLVSCPPGKTGNLVIPEGVTSIGSSAFYGCSGLDGTLTLPSTLQTIDDDAFSGCSGLTGGLVIPEGVTSIGSYAFSYCSGLTGGLVIPEGVTSVADSAFYNCSGLDGTLTLPSTLQIIESNAFNNCSGLDGTLTLPSTLQIIETNAFYNCSGLTGGLVIPEGVTTIEYSAFNGCSGLTSITIGSGVGAIGDYAFFSWSSQLRRVDFLGDAPTLGTNAFPSSGDFTVYYRTGALGFDAAGWQAFRLLAIAAESDFQWTEEGNTATITAYSGSGGNVIMPSTLNGKAVVAIGAGAFQNKISLTSIELPDTVTTIGERAFMGSGLSGEFVIPATVTAIGSQAFADCTSLGSVLFDGNEPASFGSNVFANTAAGFAVFCRSEASGFAASPWQGYTLYRWAPVSDFEYGEYLYGSNRGMDLRAYNGSAETLVIPGEIDGLPVSSIGWYIDNWGNNTTTTRIVIPSSVLSVGPRSFAGFNQLEAYRVSAGNPDLVSVDGVLFSKVMDELIFCPQAKTGEFTIPSTITKIDDYALYNCSGLTGDLEIPSGVTSIGREAFYNCSGLTGSLVIPSGVTSIDYFAFYNCSGLTGGLVIPDGVTSIGYSAFGGCRGLSSITIGSGVESIGSYAFDNCVALERVEFRGNAAPTMEPWVFSGANPFFVVFYPSGASGFSSPTWQEHPSYAMTGESDLQWTETGTTATITVYSGGGGFLVLPSALNGKTVTSIGSGSFQNRTDITGLMLPSGLERIEADAFAGCSGIQGVLDLPEGLTYIGERAFDGCIGLVGDVVIPASVTELHSQAFRNCSGLAGVTFLGNAPSTFGSNVFQGTADGFSLYCSADATGFTTPLWNGYPMLRWAPESDFVCETTWAGLWGITGYTGSAEHLVIPGIIGGKVVEMIAQTSLGSWEVSTAPTFTSVDIPSSVKRIEQSAFRNCVSLTTVSLPEGLQILEGYAFYGCSGLTAVRLPSTLAECDGSAFTGCSSLTGFEVAAGNPFAKSVNGLVLDQAGETLLLYPAGRTGLVVIPDGIKTIGDSVFYGCEGFTGFSFPSTLLEIGDYAFGSLRNVYELTIPDSVTTIGRSAFYSSSLGNVTLGTGVLSIGESAFGYGSNLAWVRFMGDAPVLGDYVFSGSRTGFTVYYEAGATGFDGAEWVTQAVPLAQWNPAVNPNWLVEDDGAGVKLLGYAIEAENLVIPNTINGKTVVSIAASAFQFKTQFSGTLTIGSGVTAIEEGTFRGASNLTAVVVDAANPSFASQNGLLYNKALSTLIVCPGGKEGALSVPSGTVEIGSGAFESCAKLTSIHLPASVQTFEGKDTLACGALTAFTVDAANASFVAVDGVLFSKDGLTLVRCPEGKAGATSIPSEVMTIASYAFRGCSLLTGELTLPSGLTSIGNSAFYNCTGLTGGLVIPDGVTNIGEYAFSYCTGFDGTLTLPAGLTSIGNSAFSNCFGLTGGLVIPDGVTNIGNFAFYNCTGLTGGLVIPAGVTSIPFYSFAGCSGITSVTLPAGLTEIGQWAFSGCLGLESITIPSGVTSIGSYAFVDSYGSELESITFLGNAPTMGFNVFSWNPDAGPDVYFMAGAEGFTTPTWYDLACQEWAIPELFSFEDFECRLVDGSTITIIGYTGAGGDVVIPDEIYGKTVTAIGESAFDGRTDITGSLTLPDGLITIGDDAFSECTGLTGGLVIPEGVTSIGNGAFSFCYGFTGNLTIPQSVTTIGEFAFVACGNLTAITVDAENPNYKSVDGMLLSKDGLTLIQCPGGKTGSLEIPEGVTAIADFACFDCIGLTGSLEIPEGVTSIGESAFDGCSALTSVTIPSGVDVIGDYAFAYTDALETVIFLGNAPTTMGSGVFDDAHSSFTVKYTSGASGFETPTWQGYPCEEWVENPVDPNWQYEIADNAVTITGYAGAGQNLVIPATIEDLPVTAIGDVAFLERTDLSGSFTLGANINSIGFSAFWGCTNLTSFVVVGENATYASVDGMLFSKDLSTLLLCPQGKAGACAIPSGTDSIQTGAFSGCQNVTSIVVDGANATYASVDGVLFSKDLSKLLLCPQGKAGAYAIPSGTDSIESEAFLNCTLLTSVAIPASVASIIGNPFRGCSQLTAFVVDAGSTSYQTSVGMLLTFDGKTLVACPGGKTGSVVIPQGVETIGAYSFYRMAGLSGVLVLPDGLKVLGENSFYECTGFTGPLALPDTLEQIEWGAFYGCTGLTGDIVIPASVTTLGGGVFYGCTGFTGTLSILGPIETLGWGTFGGCSGLSGQLVLPDSITLIQGSVFGGCSGFTGELVLPAGLTKIEYVAFSGCTGISSVRFPVAFTELYGLAFYNCSALTEAIFLGNAPTMVGNEFDGAHSSFKVKYKQGATGFTTPTWQGYPCEEMVSNRAPRFRIIGNKTIKAGQTITFQVIADDEDVGDVLQYSATNP